jgi:predicted dehydrogenase
MRPLRIGVLGCGNISGQYMKYFKGKAGLEVLACADRILTSAEKVAKENAVPRFYGASELMADKDIDLVLNLTIPASHVEMSLQALQAGKHVYSEKPLGLNSEGAGKLIAAAAAKKLRMGCAPDTVLGPGIQTCRKLIDEGAIGRPLGAVAFMASSGPESWHPNPAFLYEFGAGPLMDMGPYYLSALINLLGPINRVAAIAKKSYEERLITSQPLNGTKIKVEMPTYVSGSLEFEQGTIATLMISFDVWHHQLPRIEIYGSEGSLSVPDPNGFGGIVKIRRSKDKEWQEVPLIYPSEGVGRGLGVSDMASALEAGRPHRASAEIAAHVLEAMESLHASSVKGTHISMKTRCERPEIFLK